jgi:hypothetical protein
MNRKMSDKLILRGNCKNGLTPFSPTYSPMDWRKLRALGPSGESGEVALLERVSIKQPGSSTQQHS